MVTHARLPWNSVDAGIRNEPDPDLYKSHASTTHITAYPKGPMCTNCAKTEAKCAREGGECCAACTHMFGEGGGPRGDQPQYYTFICGNCGYAKRNGEAGRPPLSCPDCGWSEARGMPKPSTKTCGICGGHGHDRRTCPDRDEFTRLLRSMGEAV